MEARSFIIARTSVLSSFPDPSTSAVRNISSSRVFSRMTASYFSTVFIIASLETAPCKLPLSCNEKLSIAVARSMSQSSIFSSGAWSGCKCCSNARSSSRSSSPLRFVSNCEYHLRNVGTAARL